MKYIALVLIMISHLVVAQIYQYTDENGNIAFSDQPPKQNYKKMELEGSQTSTSSLPENLIVALHEQFKPSSPLDFASIATVSVKSPIGHGSGFFVSESGYIVTNKHVIRPAESKKWKERVEVYKDAEIKFKQREQELRQYRQELYDIDKKLADYKKRIAREPEGPARQTAQSEYTMYKNRHAARKKRYNEAKKQFESQKRTFNSKNTTLKNQSLSALTTTNFPITLKNNQIANAQLVKMSEDKDLALLRITGHKTPSLQSADSASKQGEKVYAIGSPLGLKDSVSAGIVTRVTRDSLLTDAKILPGNSGGPLVNEQGQVIGVNTAKVSARSAYEDGFGVAIPISTVLEEFGAYLTPIPNATTEVVDKTAETQ